MAEPVMLQIVTHRGDVVPYKKPQAPAKFQESKGDGVSWAGYTWNPITGCLHGCDYCLTPDTPVLMADLTWKPIGDVHPGDQVVAFDEESPQHTERRWRIADVTDAWRTRQTAYRITFDDGRQVVTSGRHKWLRDRNRWTETENLRPGDRIRSVFSAPPQRRGSDYEAGYIAGVTLGDGTFRWHPDWRSDKLGFPQSYWRVAVLDSDRVILERLRSYLANAGVTVEVRPFAGGGPRPMSKVETRKLANMPIIAGLCGERDSDDWWMGWLAGMFDAEGSTSGGSLRIAQKDGDVLTAAVAAGARFGFQFHIENWLSSTSGVRLVADSVEQARFLSTTGAVLTRKGPGMTGRKVRTTTSTIVSIDRSVEVEMVDITTSTGTFVADGLLTHNCYARAIANHYSSAFPVGFTPLFHSERLPAPANTRIPRKQADNPDYKRCFVCSMADMFGRWVPLEWIEQILDVEHANPQWEYLHLTKFPDRYPELVLPKTAWAGTSVDEQKRVRIAERAFEAVRDVKVRWLSLEPLLELLAFTDLSMFQWVVIGARTATNQPDGVGRVPEFLPPLEWVLRITDQAEEAGARVHWKPNLRAVPGIGQHRWRNEYPEGVLVSAA